MIGLVIVLNWSRLVVCNGLFTALLSNHDKDYSWLTIVIWLNYKFQSKFEAHTAKNRFLLRKEFLI